MAERETLLAALVGVARAAEGDTKPTDSTWEILFAGLRALDAPGEYDALIQRAHEEKGKLVPQCAHCASPCGRNNDPAPGFMALGAGAVKEKILARMMALAEGTPDRAGGEKLALGLFALGEDWDEEWLLKTLNKL